MKYLLSVALMSFIMYACNSEEAKEKTENKKTEQTKQVEKPVEKAKQAAPKPAGNVVVPEFNSKTKVGKEGRKVKISTSYGDMVAVLHDETPLHRDNFIKLADAGYYNDMLFHRIIAGFMIQGGDPMSKTATKGQPLGMGGPGYTVPAEFNSDLFHKKGALSAARMGDAQNPQKASSGSQFYIVQGRKYPAAQMGQIKNEEAKKAYAEVGGTPNLDGGYTVFGQVIEGLDVIDKIAAVQKDGRDRPLEDLKMTIKVIK